MNDGRIISFDGVTFVVHQYNMENNWMGIHFTVSVVRGSYPRGQVFDVSSLSSGYYITADC